MGIKNVLLEAKWQIYRPIIRLQYGFGFLIVDLFLDLRDREEEREDLLEGWKEIKKGVYSDDPHLTGIGQSKFQAVVYTVMSEAMT